MHFTVLSELIIHSYVTNYSLLHIKFSLDLTYYKKIWVDLKIWQEKNKIIEVWEKQKEYFV